jgi:hypothetical protein
MRLITWLRTFAASSVGHAIEFLFVLLLLFMLISSRNTILLWGFVIPVVVLPLLRSSNPWRTLIDVASWSLPISYLKWGNEGAVLAGILYGALCLIVWGLGKRQRLLIVIPPRDDDRR